MVVEEPQFDDLYREIIIDHYRRPRNRGSLARPTYRLEGANPVCGDEVQLDVLLRDGHIEDIAYSGQGCSISQSSASMLTERLKGVGIDEAMRVLGKFKAMMVEGQPGDDEVGDLVALEGVAKFPVRVKCALLCWNVLQEGLERAGAAA